MPVGRGLVQPGGCGHDLEPARAKQMLTRLDAALGEVEKAATWLWDAATVRGRFENVGVVFANQAAHDAYQDAPLHNQFVAENKATWKNVRVFDSFVSQG